MPERLADVSTSKDPSEQPYHVIDSDLPKMVTSKEQLEEIASIGSASEEAVFMAIAVPLLLGLLLKGVISKLWAMVGTF